MENYKPMDVPIVKEDKFSKDKCSKSDIEKSSMENVPYASLVGSIMYA